MASTASRHADLRHAKPSAIVRRARIRLPVVQANAGSPELPRSGEGCTGGATTGTGAAVGVGVAMLVIAPLIRRLMHLDTLRDDDSTELAGRSELAEPAAAGMHPERERK